MSFAQGPPTQPLSLVASNVFVTGNSSVGNAFTVQQLGAGNVASFQTSTNSTALIINPSGLVGIGTTTPGANLTVIGNVYAANALTTSNIFTGNLTTSQSASFLSSVSGTPSSSQNFPNQNPTGTGSTGAWTVTTALGTYYMSSSSEKSAQAAWQAFGVSSGSAGFWETIATNVYSATSPYQYTGGTYSTSDTNSNSYGGEWLQLQSPVQISITSLSLYPYSSAYAPGAVVVLGKNVSAGNTGWTLISNFSGLTGANQTLTTGTPANFTYLRFVFTNLYAAGNQSNPQPALSLLVTGTYLIPNSQPISIYSSGAVGIGITNPTASLQVVGNAYVSNSIQTTNVLASNILVASGLPASIVQGSNVAVFSNSSGLANVLIMNSLGLVGIGTTSPQSTLHVQGNSQVTHPTVYNQATDSTWYNLGLWDCTNFQNQGAHLKIKLLGASRYGSADAGTSGAGEAIIYGINTAGGVGGGGQNWKGWWKAEGGIYPTVSNVAMVQNGTNPYQAYLYASVLGYTQHGLSVETTGGTIFTPQFTLASNPSGTANTTFFNNFYTINYAGNIGIGTTNPSYNLEIQSSNFPGIRCYNTASGSGKGTGLFLQDQNTALNLVTNGPDNTVYFEVGAALSSDSRANVNFTSMYSATSFMYIKGSNGYVGIGTNNPGYNLDIGQFGASPYTLRVASASTTAGTTGASIRLMEASDSYGFSIENISASRLGIFRHSASVAGSEIISILRDNPYVGIGTATNLSSPLTIYNPSSTATYTGTTAWGNLHLMPNGANNSWAGITFGGSSSGTIQQSTQASITVDSNSSTGTNMRFNVGYLFANGALERLTIIGNGGLVGIGSTNPRCTLDVVGSGTTEGIYAKRFFVAGPGDNTDTPGSSNDNLGGPWYGLGYSVDTGLTTYVQLASYYGLSLKIGTGYILMNGGNVGIGLTNPTSYTLQVSGTIGATGNITAFTSDKRLKKKTGKIKNAVDKVCKLEGFTYVHNETAKEHGFKDDREYVGLSAQDLQEVLPEVVFPAPFDAENQSGQNYLTVQYERIVPLLIEAIKEQNERIKLLEKLVKER